jgi:hypothetical protein
MKLPKSFTTVTPLSKTIALAMFIVLPICAFFYGRYYQQLLDNGNPPKVIMQYRVEKPTPLASQLPNTTTTCKTDFDCPRGYYCTRVGPIIYNPKTKDSSGLTCHKKGSFVPL